MIPVSSKRTSIPVQQYDLAATLASGQAFRWRPTQAGWEAVIHGRWVRLRQRDGWIDAETAVPVRDWSWLIHYLQAEVRLEDVLSTFPADEKMQSAVRHCTGLRLLRQEPCECLASFILSSTKQIVQIQQIVGLLCERFGEAVDGPEGTPAAHTFPSAVRLAACTEAELRACKMGFRAAYLLETAKLVAAGQVRLATVPEFDLETARAELMRCPGVGRKIADCALLFAFGFPTAFPIDVWIMKGLGELYFPRRRPSLKRLQEFSRTYFGPHSGYAQQYLFHYLRTRAS